MKKHMIPMLNILLTLLFTLHMKVAQAEELPGYPSSPIAKIGEYQCLETQLTLVATPSLGSELCVSKNFSPEGDRAIRQSYEWMIQRLTSRHVIECFLEHTDKKFSVGRYSAEDFLDRIVLPPLTVHFLDLIGPIIAMRGSLPDPKAPEHEKTTIFTRAFVSALESLENGAVQFSASYDDFFHQTPILPSGDRPLPYLSLALHKDSVTHTRLPFGRDTDFWAAHLAAGLMKNMGIDGSPTELEGEPYYELRRCVYWGGDVPSTDNFEVSQ